MIVKLTGVEQRIEQTDIEPGMISVRKLNRFTRQMKKGQRAQVVLEYMAQVGEGLPQILTRRAFWPFGPQKPGQRVAPQRLFRFQAQISQQGAQFVIFKFNRRLFFEPGLKRS